MPLTHNSWASNCTAELARGVVRRPNQVCLVCTPATSRNYDHVPPLSKHNVQAVQVSVLQEAENLINGDRRDDYGEARPSFQIIADLWSVVLQKEITPEEVALCLIELKVARALNDTSKRRPIKRDSIVDIAGYASCLEKINNESPTTPKETS